MEVMESGRRPAATVYHISATLFSHIGRDRANSRTVLIGNGTQVASLKPGVKRVAGPSGIRGVTCLVLAFCHSSNLGRSPYICPMKDTIDPTLSSIPDASHLSLMGVY